MARDIFEMPGSGRESTAGLGYLPAPGAPAEAQRLAALRSYDILETEPEAAFDDITRIAAQVCQVPIALISFIDSDRQWFKSRVGLEAPETPREISICGHAMLHSGLFIVPDTLSDPRFAGNPLVTGKPGLRFYAGAPLRTPDGRPLGTVCVLDYQPRELSAEQQWVLLALARQTMTQLELRRTLALASRLSQYRSGVMAQAGHDLKQPLQVIQMLLDQVEPRLRDPADRQRLERLNAAVERLTAGLDSLTQAARAASEAETPRLLSLPIDEVLSTTAETWQEHARSKGLRLRVVRSSMWVVTDPAMVSVILGNLVGNAIKYTQTGGVLIGCRRRGASASVEIIDTGRGIAETDLDRIFTEFYQAQPRSEGLGLGLSIARRTAELLGHPLRVSSRLGKGSRFSLEIPLADRSSQQRVPERQRHILIVDDDEAVRDVIAAVLEDSGFRVSSVISAAAMRNFLSSGERVDAVILDASMREANSAALRLHAQSLRVPVVMMSGNPEAMRFARENGMALLEKPFRRQQLVDELDRAFAGAQ